MQIKMGKNCEKNFWAYYQSLQVAVYPRLNFVKEIVEKTGVTGQTARNWCLGVTIPRKDSQKEILSQITGIPKQQLFNGL